MTYTDEGYDPPDPDHVGGDGSSETTVEASLDTLTGDDYAINLHMSDDDLETYTSCGNID